MDYHRLVFLTVILQFQLSSPRSFVPLSTQEQTVRLSAPRLAVSEGDASVKLVLDRMDGSAGDLEVHYYTASFTAREGEDFVKMNGTINMEDGQTTATVEVPLIDDDVLEPIERFFFLADAEKGHIFTIIAIHDDDIYSSWSEWSDVPRCCTAACGATKCIQTRTRTCTATYKSMCSKQLREARYQPCYSDDCDDDDDDDDDDGCLSEWGQWTSDPGCKSNCAETRMRECSCDECSGPTKETKRNGCRNLEAYQGRVKDVLSSICPSKGSNSVRIARMEKDLDQLVRRMKICESLNRCGT